MPDPEPDPKAEPKIPPPEPPPPVATDLRTGTEVHPDVVAHHAAFLQGEPYYKDPNAPQEKGEESK
jgi:hypothetical protein